MLDKDFFQLVVEFEKRKTKMIIIYVPQKQWLGIEMKSLYTHIILLQNALDRN